MITQTRSGVPGMSDRLWALACSHPNQIAVVDEIDSLTWAELNRRVRVAQTSVRAEMDVASGPVVLAVTPSADAVVAYITLMCAGVPVVPADPQVPHTQLQSLAQRSGAVAVVHDDNRLSSWPASTPEPVLLKDLLGGNVRLGVGQEQDPAPALIMFTSGTTGSPSGIVCSRDQVAFAANAIQQRLDYRSGDIVASRLPLSFDYGLYQIILCVLSGARLVILGTGADWNLARRIHLAGATVVPIVPTLAEILVRSARRQPGSLETVRVITSTGEHLSEDAQRRMWSVAPAARIASMYGITECKRVAIGWAEPGRPIDHVGIALPGTELRVQREDGTPTNVREVGEIVVTGPHVCSGYLPQRPRESPRFETDPDGQSLLFTGDMGWVGSDGNLRVVGRRDGIFKLRGVRTSTAELAAAAEAVPGILRAVVTLSDEREASMWLESLEDPAFVRAKLRERLGESRLPHRVGVVAEFPMTVNGKVDGQALARMEG
ncbi:class I adenylate-forming enzyme family protein [Microbacterium sp. P04]|uniref:class I adenylate-forming enzyme family protein n=1 Tax=Microbacterium sp. P04 TaxID=3366947 RepID=UPI003744D963